MRLPLTLRVLLAVVGLLLVGTLAVDLVRRKAYVHYFSKLGALPSEAIHQSAAVREVARRYPPVAYNDATPQDAGRAFQALLRWKDDDARSRQVVHLPEPVSRQAGSLPDSNPLHVPPKRWHEELIPLAAKGLSSDQLRFLRSVVANPDHRLFRIFAGARDSDILGARYTFAQPQSDLIFFRALPIPRVSSVERAFQTSFARASLELSEGTPGAAEATLREAANGGLQMITNGLVVEAIAGSRWTRMSLLALADLYDATGRGTEAAKIRHDIDAASLDPLPPSFTRNGHDLNDIRDALPSVAARADVVPGLKWEYLVNVQTLNVVAFCVREWTFDDHYESWRADLRRHMVRRASDARFFDWITDPPKSRTNCPNKGNRRPERTDSLHRVVDQLSAPTP